MKTGRTIQEMAVEIMRQSKAKQDYLVNTGSLVMEVWDGQPIARLRLQGYSIAEAALAQGVGPKRVRKLLKELYRVYLALTTNNT